METKNKELVGQIWKEIEKASNILLHLHPSPDGDSVGSTLAVMYVLEGMGKKVTLISGDSNPPPTLSSLPGFEKIINQQIEKINLSNYDLFLILDSAAMEQVTRKHDLEIPENLMTIVIDHHQSNTRFGKINLVDESSPATCQIIFELLSIWKIIITPEIADCLYVGIYTDTGGFKYPPTSAVTLAAAAELSAISTNFINIIFLMENNNSPGRIKFLGMALSAIELFYNDNVAISAVSQKQLQSQSISSNDCEKANIPNLLKSVIGWNIGISMVETESGAVNVSMRTRDAKKYDVSKLAVAIGGGGHPAAAGGTINMSLSDAKTHLLEKAKEVYLELAD